MEHFYWKKMCHQNLYDLFIKKLLHLLIFGKISLYIHSNFLTNKQEIAMKKIVSNIIFIILFLISSKSFAEIDAALEKKLNEASSIEKIPVIIYMKDQVDLEQMEILLQESVGFGKRVSPEFRYNTIITALQTVTEQSQPIFMDKIEIFKNDESISDIQLFWIRNLIALKATPNVIYEIAEFDEVEMIYYDALLKRENPLNNQLTSANPNASEPGLRAIKANKLWEIGITGLGRLVMNIDTGVEGNNLSFKTRWRGTQVGINPKWAWFDPETNTNFPTDGDGGSQHGTHTMGIMCGLYESSHDTLGVAPQAQWIAAKTLTSSPHTSKSIAAFQWAANPDSNINTMNDVPDAINNSWYDPEVASSQCNGAGGYWDVIDAVEALGTAVVFSAGNSGPSPSTITPPKNRISSAVNIFSVGAVDGNTPTYPIASFSSRGPSICPGPDSMTIKPEVSAPGVNVRSATGTNGFRYLDGTSMASPHVAGAIALLRQAAPFLTGTELKYYLYKSATDLGTVGEDNDYGKGIIDVWKTYLSLPLNVGKVSGTVTSNGNAVSDVNVDFTDSILQVSSVTNDEGKFLVYAKIDTPNTFATYTIRAQKFGFITFTDTITIALDDTVEKNIELFPAPGGMLLIHTFDNANIIISSNVKIFFNDQVVVEGATDSINGIFTTPLPQGVYKVVVNAPSPFATQVFENIEIIENQTYNMEVSLKSVVEVLPQEISDTLANGQTSTHILTLTNTTNSEVPFRISDDNAMKREQKRKERNIQSVNFSYDELKKDEEDFRSGITQTEGSGGPDEFGYEWIDSDESNGPEFNWLDISSTGIMIDSASNWTPTGTFSGQDEGYIRIPIPFPFGFYGETYTSVYISSNGFLAFDSISQNTYTNAQIPTPGGGIDNIIAGFWDDLEIVSQSKIYYQLVDGNFVIQFTNIHRYNVNNPDYTYEYILKPNGEILIQYLEMGINGGTITSTTIGIENNNGSIGLQTVFNASYLHNELALKFFLPDASWISASPMNGILQPNETKEIAVNLNATGLEISQNYNANLFVNISHPDIDDAIIVSANLQVQFADSALMLLNRTNIDFGVVGLNEMATDSVIVKNGGLTDLEISASSNNSYFTLYPTSAIISTNQSVLFLIHYSRQTPGSDSGKISFTSNSPYIPFAEVFLKAKAVGIAHIQVFPNTFSFTSQATEDTLHQQMSLRNSGTDTLFFEIDEIMPSAIEGRGGPDRFGYIWRDSDEGDGPRYNWIDIRNVGTQLQLVNNEIVGPFALGFSFPFYENNFDSVRVCSNGFLSFTSSSAASMNGTIPSTSIPNNAIYGFWDDLNPQASGGEVHYYNANGKFIVQFTNVARSINQGHRVTFQMIIEQNGNVIVQYNTMIGSLNSATVGIENANGTTALQVVNNANYVHNNLAVLFTEDLLSWVSVDKNFGILLPLDSTIVDVRIHPNGILPGNYFAKYKIYGNSPDTIFANINLSVLVGVNDEISFIPTKFSLKQNYPNPFNPKTKIKYEIAKSGFVNLKVFDVLGREIKTLVNENKNAGYYEIDFDANNLNSGIYFYKLTTNNFSEMKKMILVK